MNVKGTVSTTSDRTWLLRCFGGDTVQQRLPGPAAPFDPSAPATKISLPDIGDAFLPPPPSPTSLQPPPSSTSPTVSRQSFHEALTFGIAGVLCLSKCCLRPFLAYYYDRIISLPHSWLPNKETNNSMVKNNPMLQPLPWGLWRLDIFCLLFGSCGDS